SGPGIRVDSGVEEGARVPVQYDPMLAKLIASGRNRDAAIARAVRALRGFPVLGVRTNVAFLIHLLSHSGYRAGDIDTGFVERHAAELPTGGDLPPEVSAAADAAASDSGAGPVGTSTPSAGAIGRDPWSQLAGWGR